MVAGAAARRAVFLDRDGVILEAPVLDGRPLSVRKPEHVSFLPGVEDACRRLADAGWLLIVVTNQPDVARGLHAREDVDAINRVIVDALPITDVFVCPHDDKDGCDCRKPRPGMIFDAARRWDIDLSASVLVGDRWRDIEAGRAAGLRTILVDHGYEETVVNKPDDVVSQLDEASRLIMGD